MSVTLMNYGATILKLMVPDKNGTAGDDIRLLLPLDGYTARPTHLWLCGRPIYNRIAKAQFTLNGKLG